MCKIKLISKAILQGNEIVVPKKTSLEEKVIKTYGPETFDTIEMWVKNRSNAKRYMGIFYHPKRATFFLFLEDEYDQIGHVIDGDHTVVTSLAYKLVQFAGLHPLTMSSELQNPRTPHEGEALLTAIGRSAGGKAETMYGTVQYVVHQHLVKDPSSLVEERYCLWIIDDGEIHFNTSAKQNSFDSLTRILEDGGVSVNQPIWRSL